MTHERINQKAIWSYGVAYPVNVIPRHTGKYVKQKMRFEVPATTRIKNF